MRLKVNRFNCKNFISHRGNLNGSQPDRENTLEYIKEALSKDYQVEIDVRYNDSDNLWYLGHDSADNVLPLGFVVENSKRLWVHAKDATTFKKLQEDPSLRFYCNFFFHTDEEYIFTSKSFVWVYPGAPLIKGCIAVMPEISDYYLQDIEDLCSGICSDNIEMYRGNLC